MFQKQTKISNFSNVIYTTSKNELKMMWLSRNAEVWIFSPSKIEVNAYSMWSGYSVLSSLAVSLVRTTSTNHFLIIRGKSIMDCTWLHASITKCMWTAAHVLISSQNRLNIKKDMKICRLWKNIKHYHYGDYHPDTE